MVAGLVSSPALFILNTQLSTSSTALANSPYVVSGKGQTDSPTLLALESSSQHLHHQLSHSSDIRDGSPATTGLEGHGEGFFPLPTPPYMVDEGQGSVSHTHVLGASSPTPVSGVSSIVLPRQGAEPSLPRSASGKGQG